MDAPLAAMSSEPGDARFEPRVLWPLARLARRVRAQAVFEGVAVLLAAALTAALAQYVLDRLLFLEVGPRAAMLAVAVMLLVVVARRVVVAPLRGRLTVSSLAAVVEHRDAALRDELISAVQFARGEGAGPAFDSPALVSALIGRVADRFERFAWGTLQARRRLYAHALLLLGVLGAAAAAAWFAPETTSVFVHRNLLLGSEPWPSRTRLRPVGFEAGVLRWPRGDPLTLVVVAEGDPPRSGARVRFETIGGQRGQRPMAAVGERQFRVEFGPVDDSMTLWFLLRRIGVDQSSEPYRVEVIDRPSVRSFEVRVTPPGFTRQPAYDWPAGQLAGDVLTGSMVELTCEANKPLQTVALSGVADAPAVERISDRRWSVRFVPPRSGSYSFDLLDVDGLSDLRPAACVIRLTRDRPPRVRLRLPGAGDMIAPGAVLRIAAEFDDNFGLASAELVTRIQRAEPTVTTQPAESEPATSRPAEDVRSLDGFEPYQTRFTHERPLPIAPLSLAPNDRLVLYARARDFNPSGEADGAGGDGVPANEGRSAVYSLRIVTPDELLAEWARRESEWRQEFEQILRAQERVRDDLLSAGGEAQSVGPAVARELSRRERQLGQRLKTVRRNFQELLAEMEVNQLVTPSVRRRLEAGVITPLARLAETDVVDAAAMLERLGGPGEPDAPAQAALRLEEIIRVMRDVLASMVRWEGYNEAVSLLQDLLKLQSEVSRETQSEMERRLDELFGSPTTKPSRGDSP